MSATVLLVCVLLAGAVAAVGVAVGGDERPRRASAVSSGSMFHGLPRGRVAAGTAAGFVVLLATRWVLLSVVVGVMATLWRRLLRDDRADAERAKVEGIARWLEDLRDTLRGSGLGAEAALEQVASRPPDAIAAPLRTFAQRRRQGFRTEDALADLAEELAHPTSDAAIAAIRLVVSGTAGAGRLHDTVQSLAVSARDEVTARERVDRTRAVYRGSMQRLVVIGGLLVAYLLVAGGDLLDPYGTPTGQVVLALPLLMWLGCVLWLRALCRYELPQRYRIVGADAS